MTYLVIAVLAIAAFIVALPLSSLPRSARLMTRAQMAFALAMTIVLILLLAVTYVFHDDTASWIVIAAALIGYAVGHLRVVNDFLVEHWDLFDLR